jgi:hypothetical protein
MRRREFIAGLGSPGAMQPLVTFGEAPIMGEHAQILLALGIGIIVVGLVYFVTRTRGRLSWRPLSFSL